MPIQIMDGLGSKDMLNIERISKAMRTIDYAVKIQNNTAQGGSIAFNMFWYE